MIIAPPPPNIEDITIFDIIRSSNAEIGLLNLANIFIKTANPIADSIIAGPFKKYTLHNRDHIRKVFYLSGEIMSPHTKTNMNPAECLLLLYACYLHDMGMAVTDDEFKKIIIEPAFVESIEKWPEMSKAFIRTRNYLNKVDNVQRAQYEAELADLQRAALANYLRPLHATRARYRSLIQQLKVASGRQDLFQINGQSFEEQLIAICESHNLNATVLGEFVSAKEDRFPRYDPIGGFYVNTQFIAALLRLSDILDFDYERTPKALFESLGIKHSSLPGAEVSLFEWQKHLAIHTIEIGKEELTISGTCTHPIIESGIREFCHVIEHEVQDTLAILKRNTTEITEKYQIILPPIVHANLKSDGYVFMDLVLKLDEAAIMSLLMGNRLYETPLAAVRELIQNAADACLVRASLLGDSSYKPSVQVSVERDNGQYWLVVKDNGIVMDEYVLKHHFFRVGSSYYKTPEYKRLFRNTVAPMPSITSKFGIGFLSTFMIGAEIEVQSKKIYPGGGTSRGNKIFIERMGALAFVQEDDMIDTGTVIKVKLKEHNSIITPEAIQKFIVSNVLRPQVPVEFLYDRASFLIEPEKYYSVDIQPKSELNSARFKMIELKIDRINGIAGKIFFVLFLDPSGKLTYRKNDELIEITTSSAGNRFTKVNPNYFIRDFEGNRITVGGFKMSFPKLTRLFRSNRSRIAFVYDFDILPNEDVDFNVQRTKILDDKLALRLRLRETILERLKASPFFTEMSDEVKLLFEKNIEKDAFDADKSELQKRLNNAIGKKRPVISEELLQRISNVLPTGAWPPSIHRTIAEQLRISNGQAYEAISMLIITGRIKNPNHSETK